MNPSWWVTLDGPFLHKSAPPSSKGMEARWAKKYVWTLQPLIWNGRPRVLVREGKNTPPPTLSTPCTLFYASVVPPLPGLPHAGGSPPHPSSPRMLG